MENRHNGATIESDALRANLLETAGQVTLDPELLVLLEVVEQFKGLHSSLEKLLYEVCHPFRNWKIILPQLRSFTVKNIHRYRGHDKGPESFRIFSRLYLEALEETGRDTTLLGQVVGAKMVWLEKFIGSCSGDDLERFGPEFNGLFTRLDSLANSSPSVSCSLYMASIR